MRYTYDSSTGTESAKLGVKEGTTATTATDPALDDPSSVLDGATIADVAIARVSLDALTPTATWLLPQLPTLKALGDSVSHGRLDMSVKNVEYGSIWAEHYGKIVVVHMLGVGITSAISPFGQMTMGTIPSGYRPSVSVTAAVYATPATAIVMATPEGDFNLLARDNTVITGWNIDGTLTYLAG